MLHTFTWICNVFGVFFIIAAHEHYSIDVFVAFYIASRLFMYYHTLANQKLPHYYTSLKTDATSPDNLEAVQSNKPKYDDENEQQQILQFWFPLFTFFESGVEGGKIPNEFQYPFTLADFKAVKDFFLHCMNKGFNALVVRAKGTEESIFINPNELSMSEETDLFGREKTETKNTSIRKRYSKKKPCA